VCETEGEGLNEGVWKDDGDGFRYGFVYARPQQFGALHIADALRVRARA